jgi:hypothetical protein
MTGAFLALIEEKRVQPKLLVCHDMGDTKEYKEKASIGSHAPTTSQ